MKTGLKNNRSLRFGRVGARTDSRAIPVRLPTRNAFGSVGSGPESIISRSFRLARRRRAAAAARCGTAGRARGGRPVTRKNDREYTTGVTVAVRAWRGCGTFVRVRVTGKAARAGTRCHGQQNEQS